MDKRFIDLNRRRAIIAYNTIDKAVERINKSDDNKKKRQELRTLCRKLPVLIQQNSLTTTLMYLSKSKNEDDEKKKTIGKYLYDCIIDWLKECNGNEEMSNFDFFINVICSCNMRQYKALTDEALQFTNWLKNNVDGSID